MVALKVIGVGSWATESHLRRFRREAEAAARINHPSIVSVHEIGERNGYCYFSMHLVEGSSLDEISGSQPVLSQRAAEIIASLARTVHYAHEHGIIHRDIKPANILLDENGAPHLTDFGLARLRETESNITRTTELLGTPGYMSPEQASGTDSEITEATDIYSLGAVLYHLLTGQPPFAGKGTYETVRLVCDAAPVPPRVRNPAVDRDLSTICVKCLNKDPKGRYDSALALAEDLERWLRDEPIKARRISVFERGTKCLKRNFGMAAAGTALVGLTLAIIVMVSKNRLDHRALRPGVAVLPFENLSDSKENEFLAGGIQDELLSDLSRINGLKVISRTSVMSYRSGVTRNLKEIAQQLGVDHIVEGMVSRHASRLRVSVQLIDAGTDTHLWAQKYDRDVGDALTIQSEIAQQIASQLRTQLSPAEQSAIAERPTKDLVAYALYAKARELESSEEWQSAAKSFADEVELLQKATQRDPNFGLAWCALAKAHSYLRSLGSGDATQLELEKEAADAAVKVRPDLGESHLALARYYWLANNYERARQELGLARSKLPNSSEALMIEALIERHQNQWDSAVTNLRRANELDPHNGEIRYHLADVYLDTRHYRALEELLRRPTVADIQAELAAKTHLALVKLAEGDGKTAQSLLDQVPLDYSVRPHIWEIRLRAALYRRDDVAINQLLNVMPQRWLDLNFGGDDAESFSDRLVALQRAHKERAQPMFKAARDNLQPPQSYKGSRYFVEASSLDAMLGRKEDAISEALRAVEILPMAEDSLNAPVAVTNLARVYALAGERGRALDQLEKVAQIPAGPSYGDLRLNPCWEPLRGDPRFESIVAASKAASR